MADGEVAAQDVQVILVEDLRDEAQSLVDVGQTALAGANPRALLPAMLQGVEREKRQPGHVHAGRVDATDTTGFFKFRINITPYPPRTTVARCCSCTASTFSRSATSPTPRIFAANNAALSGSSTTAGATPDGVRSDE